MIEKIKEINVIKSLRKTMWYSRFRQYLPMTKSKFVDDSESLDEAEIVNIDWPIHMNKPVFGIIQDDDKYPKWTKYRRFMENNKFGYGLFDIHSHNWIEQSRHFDIIIGIPSNSFYELHETRIKFEVLETYLGKFCYPSSKHLRLYEDKCFEAFISKAHNLPFAKTYISYEKEDAHKLSSTLELPFISKVVPSSGSLGVELIKTREQSHRIVDQAFSMSGRKTHLLSYRQKNFVYFQKFIPNDGYDIRVVTIGNSVFGTYRKVPNGEFRASGMKLEEKRELPLEAMKIGRMVNQIIKSPVLAVDMVHSLDGNYFIVEFSPSFQMDSSAEFCLNGIPGIIIFDSDDTFHFEKGNYWLAELALKEFLKNHFLPFCGVHITK